MTMDSQGTSSTQFVNCWLLTVQGYLVSSGIATYYVSKEKNADNPVVLDFFNGDLAKAILSKDIDQLRHTLRDADLVAEGYGRYGMTVVDLAIGWPEGLGELGVVWKGSVVASIEVVALERDRASLQMLCDDFEGPPSCEWDPVVYGDDIINTLVRFEATRDILINHLKKKRESLSEIARQYLRSDLLVSLGLSGSADRVLDANAGAVYKLLRDRRIAVPYRLDWGHFGQSIYGMVIHRCREAATAYPTPARLLGILDDLYQSGFRDVDTSHLDGLNDDMCPAVIDFRSWNPWMSPLEIALDIFGPGLNYKSVAAVSWILRMNAEALEFDSNIRQAPINLLLRLQEFATSGFEGKDLSPLTKLVQYGASICSPTERDGCTCFCSSGGCLPLADIDYLDDKVWQRCSGYVGYVVFWWMESCGPETQERLEHLEQAVRLEIFQRLGMRHTCCRGVGACRAPSDSGCWESEGMESESVEIRQEDSWRASQLDLMMEAYRGSIAAWLNSGRAESGGSAILACTCLEPRHWSHQASDPLAAHWQQWWKKVDQVLPDTKGMLDSDALDMEDLTLEQHGFKGVKFYEVIQRHFLDELQTDSSQYMFSTNGGDKDHDFVPTKRIELLDALLEELRILPLTEDSADEWPSLSTRTRKIPRGRTHSYGMWGHRGVEELLISYPQLGKLLSQDGL